MAASAVALTLAAAVVLTGGGRPAVPVPAPSRAELDGRWAVGGGHADRMVRG